MPRNYMEISDLCKDQWTMEDAVAGEWFQAERS